MRTALHLPSMLSCVLRVSSSIQRYVALTLTLDRLLRAVEKSMIRKEPTMVHVLLSAFRMNLQNIQPL